MSYEEDEVSNRVLAILMCVFIVILLAQCFFVMRMSSQIEKIISEPVCPEGQKDLIIGAELVNNYNSVNIAVKCVEVSG